MKGGEQYVPRNNQLSRLRTWPRFLLPAWAYPLCAMFPEQKRRDRQTGALSGKLEEKREGC